MVDEPNELIRQWMLDTIREKDISAEQWARKAGVAPTTITQFLKEGHGYLPSTTTMIKLAKAVGSTITFTSPTENKGTKLVPVYEGAKGWKEKRMTSQVSIPLTESGAYAITLEAGSKINGGMMPGDRLICIPVHGSPPSGQIVAAIVSGIIGVYHYYAPLLISSEGTTIKDSDADIIGFVKSLIRKI